MSDESAFITAMLASPDDDTPRLVFADWLEECGDRRAPWVRDPAIWKWMQPDAAHPVPRMLAAIPAERLSRYSQRPDPELRATVCSLLHRLGPSVIMEVRRWLRDHPEHWPCHGVQKYVAAYPPTPLRSVDELRAELRKTNWYDLWEAIVDLGFHGPEAVPALPDLFNIEVDPRTSREMDDDLDPEDDPLANAFNRTIGRIGPAAMEAASGLAEDLWYHETAREAILLVRPDPELVLEYINTDNDLDTELGVDIAAQLAPDRVAFLTRVTQAHGESRLRAAINLLGQMGPQAVAALPVLTKLSRDEGRWDSDRIRSLATEAIAKIQARA